MKKKEKTNPKNGSCKCWRFDSIIIKDNFLAVLRFVFFLVSLLKIGLLIFHLTLSVLIIFGGRGWEVGICVWLFVCFVFILK